MPSKNGLKGAVSGQREQGISLVPRDQLNYTKCVFCLTAREQTNKKKDTKRATIQNTTFCKQELEQRRQRPPP